MPSVIHSTDQYENNRAEVSHEPTRQRERQMRKFKSPGQAQRFLSVHGLVQNLFRVGANCCKLAITESYGVARSSLGTPSRAPRDSNGDVIPAAPACSRNVNLTVVKLDPGTRITT
ncbi:MAG: DDE domain-containing protein [Acidobacteria bacterium]|nr:MAG: DDE domain-containing protein [Acidobacteriota bacterium]